jgi:hypothetical protein
MFTVKVIGRTLSQTESSCKSEKLPPHGSGQPHSTFLLFSCVLHLEVLSLT